MVKRLVVVLSLLACLPLLAPPASASIPWTQMAVMIKDGPTRDVYMSKFSDYDWQGRPRFAKSHQKVDLNVYRLYEKVRKYDYYALDVDLTRVSHSGASIGWEAVTASTVDPTTQSSYTEGVSSPRSSCVTLSASLNAGIGPIGGSVGVSRDIFCGQKAKGRLKVSGTRGRVGRYTVYAPGLAKLANFKKIIRVKAKAHPEFKVRVSSPCDYENPVHDLIRETCHQSFTLTYAGKKRVP